ncbi:hypothetical protein A0J61_11687 [Choanephora cucurbitarum]|uniref:Uncharacterized protein n=1 Tax=Choanephora cucurbitarum TaxID=101091 RepID=A0A1C7MYR8_9FUNG|nr:hypothetical protein A0J61_11687 [Choanephora cucurbitarum]
MKPNNEAGPSTRNDMVIPDNEHYQNMIRARVAMEKNTQMIIAENQTYRPVNTTVAYTAKQNEWFEWCKDLDKFPDGPLVYDTKLAFFLEDHVMRRGRKLKKKDDRSRILLDRESILQNLKAIKNIWVS